MPTFLFVFFHVIFAGSVPDEHLANENKFVKVDVALANAAVRSGGKGTILVSFAPVDGIHINADPPLTLKLEKNRLISLRGKPIVSTDKESGFLSTSAPIEQGFHVSRNAKPGEHVIKGTIVYYFCSDAEGWCTRFAQPITLTLNIQRK